MKNLRIEYRGAGSKIGMDKLSEMLTATPSDLARFLQKKGLVNPGIDVTKLLAYWQDNNTVVLYLAGHRLSGIISIPKRL